MTDQPPLYLKPTEGSSFDFSWFQWLIDQQAAIDRLYGPRLTAIRGQLPLLHWLLRQFPPVDPGVSAVNLFGSIPVTVDDGVPLDSLRLTYADGTHKDVRVISPPTDLEHQWPPPGYLDLGHKNPGDIIDFNELPPGTTSAVWTE